MGGELEELRKAQGEPVAWLVESFSGWIKVYLPAEKDVVDEYSQHPETHTVTPLYTAVDGRWKEVLDNEAVVCFVLNEQNKDDPRKMLHDIINWHVAVALDPQVSSDAQALIDSGAPPMDAKSRLKLKGQINDLMTAGGATLTEHQSDVLYAAIKVLDIRLPKE